MFTKKLWIFLKYWKCLSRKCGFFRNTGNVYQENVDFFETLEMFTKKMWIFLETLEIFTKKMWIFLETIEIFNKKM